MLLLGDLMFAVPIPVAILLLFPSLEPRIPKRSRLDYSIMFGTTFIAYVITAGLCIIAFGV